MARNKLRSLCSPVLSSWLPMRHMLPPPPELVRYQTPKVSNTMRCGTITDYDLTTCNDAHATIRSLYLRICASANVLCDTHVRIFIATQFIYINHLSQTLQQQQQRDMAVTATILLMASKHKADPSSSPEDANTHIDRNSVIALSIILFLVLVAIAWYLRLHYTHKRQADLEQQSRCGQGRFDQTTERVTWNRQCNSCGEEIGRVRSGSLFKLKSVLLRKDSVATSSSRSSSGTENVQGNREKRKWPGLSQWRIQGSRTSMLGPNAFALHQNTLPLTSTERPSPTHSRRQSQRGSFDPLPLHNPLYHTSGRRRSSSLSQDAYDKRWWNEVARRGSTTSPTRRWSILDTVLEPGVRGHTGDSRAAGGFSTVGRDHGGGSTGSAHASWRGSRSESVMYDWRRPTDAEVHAKNFGDVIWDGPHRGRGSKEEENIQSMDWALKM